MGPLPQKIKIGFLIFFKFVIRKKKEIATTLVLTGGVIFLLFVVPVFGPDHLSEGIIGTYQEDDLPEVVIRLLSQSLVEVDENGRMIGKLASSWEVNNDATIFKFKLRKDLLWSDGSKLRSEDLKFSIPDVEISYPNEDIVQFKLKDSFSPFPSLLTKPIFKKGTLIGTGSYTVERVEKSRIFITKMLLKPVSSQKDLPQITIRFYPNENISHLAFEAGEVQSLLGITDTSQINKNPLANLTQKPIYTRIVSILYNTKDPVLSNRSLRQALSYSAPNVSNEIEAKTPIIPSSWAYSSEVNDYLSNPDKAKAALTRVKNSSTEEIFKKEIVLTSTPQLEIVGQQMISAWKKLGIKVVLRVESGIPQNFQALLIAQNIPADPDQYSLWHSTQTKTNLTKYSSARIDKDLEDGRKLLKEEDRKAKYADFQKTLLEDSPATFLYFPKYNIIYLKKAESLLNRVLSIQLATI